MAGLDCETSATRIPKMVGHELGPILELWRLGLLSSALDRWLDAPLYHLQLTKILSMTDWISSDGRQGVVSIQSIVNDEANWQKFYLTVREAAMIVGFSKNDAWKIIASIGEIYTNVIEHSEHPRTGLIAYAARPGNFEYVISDAGIGVLKSLQKNHRYATESNYCKALELALSEGVSAKVENGRGFGFRPLFIGLANLSRCIRFRSGDAARILSRQSNGTLPATSLQRAWINGFFCSVTIDTQE